MEKRNTTELADPANESFAAAAGLSRHAVEEISDALRRLLADVFALYLKTKNFHWHMTGNHFRDYHLLLDEQGEQIFAMTDDIAERARKIGGTTLRSIGDVARHQRLTFLDDFAGDLVSQDHTDRSCSAASYHMLVTTADIGAHDLKDHAVLAFPRSQR